ncbi:MAG: tetratricopeptide repeat protein [Sphingomonadales bacterium]
MNKFFAELKRRNVVRVAIAYAVVAWVILQFVDVIADPMSLPEWFQKVTIVLLAIGFPIALIFSWAFEVTPEGVKKTKEVDASKSMTHGTGQRINKLIIGALVLALGFIAYDKVIAPGDTGVRQAEAETVSIAVLPFVNMSSDPEQEYFGDGITEELLNTLVRVPGLNVAARTSAFSYKGKNMDVRDIGAELGVDTIVEGSVRRSGDDLRITAQLIRVEDGFHLWSQTYDRKYENVFAIQEEIAFAISDAVQVPLGLGEGSLVSNRMQNMEAYDQYLKARRLIRSRGDGLAEAVYILREVVKEEPNYAPAWAAMATALGTLTGYFAEFDGRPIQFGRLYAEAEIAALKAVTLDPDLADAHHAYGNSLRDRGAYVEAEDQFKIAFELDPNSIEILEDFNEFYQAVLYLEEALELAERAYGLEPNSTLVLAFYGDTLARAGRTAEAVAMHEKALEIDPAFTWSGSVLIETYLMNNEPEKTLAHLEANNGYWEQYSKDFSKPAMDFEPLRAKLRGETLDLPEDWQGSYWQPFYSYFLSGDDGFLDNLEFMAYNNGASYLFYEFPGIENIRKTERYKALVLFLGVVDYWRERGWPNVCWPVGDFDFECGAAKDE